MDDTWKSKPSVPPPLHPPRASATYAELVASLIYDLLGSTDIRLSILDTEGNCISQQGSFDIICQYAHSDTVSYAACQKCSHQAVDEARRLARPYTYRCYMGLAVTVFPLLHEGACEGFLLMNGYSMEREEMERLPIYRDELDLTRYFPGLEIRKDDRLYLPKARVDAMIQTVSTTIAYLDALNQQVASLMELHNRSIEFLTTANVKAQTENKDLMRLVQEASYVNETDFFFNAMNHISTVAWQEGAEKTARLLQYLSMHMRKGTRPGVPTTLGEEMEHIHSMFVLYSSMYEGRVSFHMDVGAECSPELQLLQLPLGTVMDVLLGELLRGCETDGTLLLRIRQRQNVLDVSISINWGTLSEQAVFRLNAGIQYRDDARELILYGVVTEQRELYGSRFAWKVSCTPKQSTELLLCIPLKDVIQ